MLRHKRCYCLLLRSTPRQGGACPFVRHHPGDFSVMVLDSTSTMSLAYGNLGTMSGPCERRRHLVLHLYHEFSIGCTRSETSSVLHVKSTTVCPRIHTRLMPRRHQDVRQDLRRKKAPIHTRVKHSIYCWKLPTDVGPGVRVLIYIPMPRDATSVATMIGLLPVLNWSRTQSRSFCCLSPWIAG
jgi:hypothetical protein